MNRATMAALALGALGFVYAGPASAQTAADRPDRSLEIGVGGTPSIAYWTKQSERTDLGLIVAASLIGGDGSTEGTINLGPALRWYWNDSGTLAPYTQAGIDLSYRSDLELWGLGGRVGIGLDWFPIESLSLGGHAGLLAQYQGVARADIFLLRTFSSGILLRLFF